MAFGEDEKKSALTSFVSVKSSAIDEEEDDEVDRPATSAAAETGQQASSIRACSARQHRKNGP